MKKINYLLLLVLVLIMPLFLVAQDSITHKVNRVELSSSVNLLRWQLDCGSETFLSTNVYLCGKKNDFGVTYFRNLYPGRFGDNIDEAYYGVDSGGGRLEHGIRLAYRRTLYEGNKVKYNNKLAFNIGATYLWGKIPYHYLKSPGIPLYAVREKGAILSSGISWYKRITGPLWFTSTADAGLRLISMKKNELSLRDAKKFFNFYLGVGLAFKF